MPARKASKTSSDHAAAEGHGLAALGPVLDFLRLLWAVDHGLNRFSKRMETEIGVTGPQRLAIRIIGQFPWITAGGLAAILHVHPSTLTGILHRLRLRRLIVRRADARDARRALLRLTTDGKRCDARQAGTIEAVIEQVLARCTRQQIEATSVFLATLANALDAEFDNDD